MLFAQLIHEGDIPISRLIGTSSLKNYVDKHRWGSPGASKGQGDVIPVSGTASVLLNRRGLTLQHEGADGILATSNGILENTIRLSMVQLRLGSTSQIQARALRRCSLRAGIAAGYS